MNKKIDIDYLTYNDLNNVENEIYRITEILKQRYESELPSFQVKTWVLNELPFIQEIDRIEKGITNLGYYIIRPIGWLPDKEWITQDNPYPIKSFDYKDWNRWVNNLQLAENITGQYTLWNGISLIDWNIESNEEWEEI